MTSSGPHEDDRSPAVPVTMVHACLREGTGGSPTAVVAEPEDGSTFDDATRRRIPSLAGVSHAVFVRARQDGAEATVRFFTAEGELPACGHGTVAALAYLAERAGAAEHPATLHTAGGRTVAGRAVRRHGLVRAEFEVGPVELREPTAQELGLVLPALGLPLVAAARVATLGRPRLLVRLPSRRALDAVTPDLAALADACRGLDLLGCYAYAAPTAPGRRHAARMFAPAIGVPEDIANANSTACLAALLHATGLPAADLAVDMGDLLGSPATISASVVRSSASAPPLVRVGGTARVEALRHLG